MAVIYLALGSNLGDRNKAIKQAVAALRLMRVIVRKVSPVIETDPIGGPAQGKYLNAVLCANTMLSPDELLLATRSIEHKLGRIRGIIDGPRTIDIDVLLYDDIKLVTRHLIIPHPKMLERDFVMHPLKRIAPGVFNDLINKI